MAIPDYQTVMLPLLKLAADGKEHKVREAIEDLADSFALTEDEQKELLPSGGQATFHHLPPVEGFRRVRAMRVHNGFLVVLMALIMSLMGVVHLEAAAAQQTDGGQQSDGDAPPHDDGGPPVEEYGSDDTSGDGGGLGVALLLIVALVFIDRVRRVNARATRRPKVSASTHNATLGALVGIDRLWRASGLSRSPKGSDSTQDVSHVSRNDSQSRHVESMLRRGDITRDEINYMSGPEFEKFMADFLRRQGYAVEETPLSGDQGVDLILPDFDGKRVVVQLKRYTRPVGNVAVQATFAGMAHYRAEEGWIITTSAFTKSARELARSTRVRLIDGKELANWLEDVRE